MADRATAPTTVISARDIRDTGPFPNRDDGPKTLHAHGRDIVAAARAVVAVSTGNKRPSIDWLLPRTEDTTQSTNIWTERDKMTDESMKAELERLRAENEQLKTRTSRGISLKVSEKGGVSVYGLGRFPVTLYKEQWTRLLDMAADIRAFIKENDGKLKTKAD
jgi:hypothetical protein